MHAYGNGTRSCLLVSLPVTLDTYDCPVGGNVLIRIQGRANKHDISSKCYLLGSLLKLYLFCEVTLMFDSSLPIISSHVLRYLQLRWLRKFVVFPAVVLSSVLQTDTSAPTRLK